MSEILIDLAEQVEEIIKSMTPNTMYWFLAEIQHAIDMGFGNEELTEDWFVDADFFDIAMYCVMYGAFFDDVEIESFLASNDWTKDRYRNTDMYGADMSKANDKRRVSVACI